MPLCAWWLWPDIFRREAWWIALVVASLVVPGIVGFAKYGRLPSYHPRITRLAAGIMAVAIPLLLLLDRPLLFRAAALYQIVVAGESFAIAAVLPQWTPNLSGPGRGSVSRRRDPREGLRGRWALAERSTPRTEGGP